MAHILLGWEFGGNRGHAITMLDLAKLLRANGHRTTFVVQRLDAISPMEAAGSQVLQAPISPRLLANTSRSSPGAPVTHGDILARLGFDDPELLTSIILNWQQILAATKADLIVAEYAPLLLLAARNRLPSVGMGNGFVLPPADLDAFPKLSRGQPLSDEMQILDCVNRGLAGAGIAALDRLPHVYTATFSRAATFEELDPYREHRSQAVAMPHVREPFPCLASGEGTEIFVYGSVQIGIDAQLWQGLKTSGLPIRVHRPGVSAAYRAALAGMGFIVEAQPISFGAIARRSRLLLSHGGLGFVSSGILAGLPQVVCHTDLEKALTGLAVTKLQLGGHIAIGDIRADAFAASLAQVYHDPELARRARDTAPRFRGRATLSYVETLARAIQSLS